MANILFVTYLFPPLNSIAARRTYAWTKYLSRLGHTVTVIAAETVDDEMTKNFEVDTSFSKIYRLGHPDIRRIIKKVFRYKGPVSKQSGFDSLSGKRRMLVSLLEKTAFSAWSNFFNRRGLLLSSVRIPNVSDLWFFPAYKVADRIIRQEKINLVITSSPPPVVNLIGYALKRKYPNIVWLEDFRDLWTLCPSHKGIFPFTALENLAERLCLRKASMVTVATQVLKTRLEEKYPFKGSEIFCLENGFDAEFYKEAYDHSNLKDKKNLIYTGTLYQNRGDPSVLFKVIDRHYPLFKDKIEIHFYGSIETGNMLEKFLEPFENAKNLVSYGGFLSAKEIYKKQVSAEAYLFLENDAHDDGVLTGKIFEYFVFRKPILCVGVGPNSYVGSFLAKSGLCIFCENDSLKIQKALIDLVNGELSVCPDDDYINQFSREKQVVRLNELITKYLKGKD